MPKARRKRGTQSRSCWVAGPNQALTFFCRRRELGWAARAHPFAEARQALFAPGREPAVDRGVADGEKDGQLVQALAPVVAQHGLGPAAVAGVFGVVAARVERRHFVGGQDKGSKHNAKITPPNVMRLLLRDYLERFPIQCT